MSHSEQGVNGFRVLEPQDVLDDFRTSAIILNLPLKVVGVDPTVAERPGDE